MLEVGNAVRAHYHRVRRPDVSWGGSSESFLFLRGLVRPLTAGPCFLLVTSSRQASVFSDQLSAISYQPVACALPGDRGEDSPALTRGGLGHCLTVAALTGWLSRVKRSWRSALTPSLRDVLLALGPHPNPLPVGEGADTGR